MSRRTVPEGMPLYPSEQQVALKVLGDRAHLWPEIAIMDGRKGLPPIDPVHGGRYWPAVESFYDVINNLDRGLGNAGQSESPKRVRIVPFAPDTQERHGPQESPTAHQRRGSTPRRARP